MADGLLDNPTAPTDTENSFKFLKTSRNDSYKKEDPPLIDVKVTNPVTYLKNWWKRLMANEGVTLSIKIRPVTAIALMTTFALVFGGTGFGIAQVFFPNSSPILKREVLYQGTLKQSGKSFYLTLPDMKTYKLDMPSGFNPAEHINQQVLLNGNLTREPNLIKVKEITSF